ncbi:MAG: hypothetical protein JWM16_3153 [Verrucomicrobiales bacterium]|jgi:hypothetical protein|nr:hypothetical protein [Verrucomicrobiales bacterium]
MKQLLLMAGAMALLAGCSTYNRNEPGYAHDVRGVGGVSSDSDIIRGEDAGFDRLNTGTETGRGTTDLGVASPGDQRQREPIDPRRATVVPYDSRGFPATPRGY